MKIGLRGLNGLALTAAFSARHSSLESCIDPFLEHAIAEARAGLREGGIPIGSVLVCEGAIIGRGHNQRVQRGSVIHHAEMNCLENAGRQTAAVYRRCTIYSTLSPCPMCSGAIVLYGIPRVVIGENVTFKGAEEYMRANGVQVDVLQNEDCIALMRDFIRDCPELWQEDIGV
jgi:cytosine deaminase